MNFGTTKNVTVNVEAKTIYLTSPATLSMTLKDQDDSSIGGTFSGARPAFIPSVLHIDVDTGCITNWRVPTQAELTSTF